MSQPTCRQPAEWDRHSACWLAWPSHGHLWRENLAPAQAEWAALGRAIAEEGGESLDILVQDATAEAGARAALPPVPCRRPASASTAGAVSTCCPTTTGWRVGWRPLAAFLAPTMPGFSKAGPWTWMARAPSSPPASAC